MANISITDQPFRSGGGQQTETLGLITYAKALADFVAVCDTPLTIGVQGEWGSGKTSLLNLVCEHLDEKQVKTRGRAENKKGIETYRQIWVNTWEHSLLKTPEECLLSIISELIDEIARVDGRYESANKAKGALKSLAKGAATIGAGALLGGAASGVVSAALEGDQSGNSVKELRKTLSETIESIVESNNQEYEKFIVIIDDLDRLDPIVAVAVIELLKNIFDIKHCIFILAVDYQVVVKGLRSKFGEQTEENEWEFRAFFDKIIQLPFMMPISEYELEKYTSDLLEKTSFFKVSELNTLKKHKWISRIVLLTVGHNPRALKRLTNSLSLIMSLYGAGKGRYKDEELFKILLFALVCLQISMPKIYEVLRQSPKFFEWDEDVFLRSVGIKHFDAQELNQALEHAKQRHEDDFDEVWEETLFKMVWANKWQRSRVVEASKLLSILNDEVLGAFPGKKDEFEQQVAEAMKLTAVTSVTSADQAQIAQLSEPDEDKENSAQIMKFWSEFNAKMTGTDCVFDYQMRSIRSSPYITRKSQIAYTDNLSFTTRSKSNWAIKIASNGAEPKLEGKIFEALKKQKQEVEQRFNAVLKVKVSESGGANWATFKVAGSTPRLDYTLEKNKKEKEIYLNWLHEYTKPVEEFIAALELSEDETEVGAG